MNNFNMETMFKKLALKTYFYDSFLHLHMVSFGLKIKAYCRIT